ncbi:U3 small nucleolar ribonucleoprotein (snoRNP) component [Pseudoloma neurophilia]|uniref:U3 small nucleolar ribonucleoprotein (snoRNP) component n=1 Tax=Pseudoloma neurophilia TaxID=146866 RepID=A0A0R0LX48_9MICR|nr:U3 small nucleolar ribonucleoprotein (snoRNP) component [Pseudoloma neurophilia]
MRKLKFHESRLLRKTNFLQYEETTTEKDHKIISMYQIENREQLIIYKRILSMVKDITISLASLSKRNGLNNSENTSNNSTYESKYNSTYESTYDSTYDPKSNEQKKVDILIKIFTDKLYKHGLIRKNNLKDAANLKMTDICERRITTLLKRQNFAESIKDAVKLIKQGHILIGNKPVRNIDVLVTNGMENFIKWKDSSKHKKCIDKFNDNYDEYEN